MKEGGKKRLEFVFKLLLSAGTLAYVYYKLIIDYSFDRLLHEYEQAPRVFQPMLLLIALLLLVFNWGLEALKWQRLICKTESISFGLAFKAVLAGTTVSLFTPNRVGEYAGRVLFLQPGHKLKSALATMIGSFSQLVMTVVAGSASLMLMLPVLLPGKNLTIQTVFWISIIFSVLVIILYFNTWVISPMLSRIPLLRKYHNYLHVFEEYSYTELASLLLLSALRYLVFTLQYILLLYAFGISMEAWLAFKLIAIIFLVQAIVPSFALSELGIRGATALYFFSFFSQQNLPVLLAAYTLWVINLIIPALFGLFFTLRLKLLLKNNE